MSHEIAYDAFEELEDLSQPPVLYCSQNCELNAENDYKCQHENHDDAMYEASYEYLFDQIIECDEKKVTELVDKGIHPYFSEQLAGNLNSSWEYVFKYQEFSTDIPKWFHNETFMRIATATGNNRTLKFICKFIEPAWHEVHETTKLLLHEYLGPYLIKDLVGIVIEYYS